MQVPSYFRVIMDISIIIPTLNEAESIGKLIEHLRCNLQGKNVEIWVSDGGSNDETVKIAGELGVHVLEENYRCRAKQMNAAAKKASGRVLYFVHADTLPPASFAVDIEDSVAEGKQIGGYRFQFDSNKAMLRFNSWMTRFNVLSFRGGDQSLFITRDLWEKLGGFDEKYVVMEEYDLLRRAKEYSSFTLIQKDVLVSARKYDHLSWFRVNFANSVAMIQFKLGVNPQQIKDTYSKFLKNNIIGYRKI
jgi:rSAM/selenodomain-associated transferase 2